MVRFGLFEEMSFPMRADLEMLSKSLFGGSLSIVLYNTNDYALKEHCLVQLTSSETCMR